MLSLLRNVATISANNDSSLGDLVAEVVSAVGEGWFDKC